jgi:2'-5' RNA ligase
MSIRSFIAIETPVTIRKAIADVQFQLKESHADVRWESPEKLHATIKFLGNVEAKALSAVTSTIEGTVARFHPFELTYGELGCFPGMKHPRVVWVGCRSSDDSLPGLRQALDDALLKYGFEKEERPFHPHITLGRVKSNRGIDHLTPLLKTLTLTPVHTRCAEVVLMRSMLRPQGSEYSVLARFPFPEQR